MSLWARYKDRFDLRGFFYVGPAFVFLLLIVIFPLFKVFQYSFQEYFDRSFVFTGLMNYQRLFSDELFWLSIKKYIYFYHWHHYFTSGNFMGDSFIVKCTGAEP